MKKLFAIAALLVGPLAAVAAHAGAPTAVPDANGAIVWPTEPALSIQKDTSAGRNRAQIKYQSGFQYAEDNASWSVYNAVLAGMVRPVLVPGNPNGLAYDTAKAIIGCNSNQTYVSWPLPVQAETLADNCAYRNAAKQ